MTKKQLLGQLESLDDDAEIFVLNDFNDWVPLGGLVLISDKRIELAPSDDKEVDHFE